MSGYANLNQAPYNPYGQQPQQPQPGFPQQQNLQPPAGYPQGYTPSGFSQPHSYSGYDSGQDDGGDCGGSAVPGWLIWIAFLIGFNVCSYLFDWPIWIY